jgi:hypothetical protein
MFHKNDLVVYFMKEFVKFFLERSKKKEMKIKNKK